jgi:hypothetical protein
VDWFDARQGAQSVARAETTDGKRLQPPGDGDWLLMLTAKAERAIRETNGVVAFEAELGTGDWRLIATPTGRGIEDPGAGRMLYEIEFAQTGNYYVFLLACQGPLGKHKENDVLLSLSGEKLFGQDDRTRPDGIRSYGDWKWARLPKGPGAHTPNPIRDGPVYFRVTRPGIHRLEIAHRSANFAIDRVLLKRDDPTPP